MAEKGNTGEVARYQYGPMAALARLIAEAIRLTILNRNKLHNRSHSRRGRHT